MTEKINCFFVGRDVDSRIFPKAETVLEQLRGRGDDEAMMVNVGLIRNIFERLDALEKKPKKSDSIWKGKKGAFYRG